MVEPGDALVGVRPEHVEIDDASALRGAGRPRRAARPRDARATATSARPAWSSGCRPTASRTSRRRRGRARPSPSEHRHRFDAATGTADRREAVVSDSGAGATSRLALLMLAPSLVILGALRPLPARSRRLARPPALRRDRRATAATQRLGPVRRRRSRAASSSTRCGSRSSSHCMTVPVGLALGIGLAVLADKHLRGIGVLPHHLLVARSRRRRRRLADVVVPAAARRSACWPTSAGSTTCSRCSRAPGLLQRPRHGAAGRRAVAASGPTSASRSSSSPPALQSIPRELHESAYVDGAGGVRRFTNVTLPMLSPTLLFVGDRADDPGVPDVRRDRPADRRRPDAAGQHARRSRT